MIDRFYFRSVYFREPSGVLFEIATIGPGFAVDEDAEHLGERLSLPPRFEPLRERLERDPHAAAVSARRFVLNGSRWTRVDGRSVQRAYSELSN